VKKLLVLVLLLTGCGVAGQRGYSWAQYQVSVPLSSKSQPVRFHVEPGESTEAIAHDLQLKGLVRDERVFLLYLRYKGTRTHLEAGDFVLNKDMNTSRIVEVLQHGRISQLSVALPEGSTMLRMAQQAEKAGIGPAQDYLAATQDTTWVAQYDFLQGRPATAPPNLEGFLFPDTYQLDKGATAHDLVKRQLDRFGQVITPTLRAQAGVPTAVRPAETLYSVVTLASIVEREVSKDADRTLVCGVFYNRLAKGMPLQDDVTIMYGLGKTDPTVTLADLQKDTPYNTYLHKGLPAGPVSNPGLASVSACLTPEASGYYFFFADPKGVTHYARNQTEFEQQKKQFGVAFQ
jgi:UPF0755 protein